MNSSPTPTPAGAHLKTILVIDDDVHLAATYALGLESHGYRALCAANAAIGWDLAHAHLPDLILCDIEMPGKDGQRLLQDMRADPALADRPFVLMTGKAAFGNERAAMDLGADDFLLKPVSLPALMGCVAARLRRAELSRRVDDRAVDRLRESLGSTLPQKFFMPLASVLGIAQLLEAEIDTQSKEEIRQDLRSIQVAGRRLHRTLRNYLQIVAMEAQTPRDPGALLAAAAVRTALAAGANAAAETHQRESDLTLELAGASLRADPADLSLLTEELVDNALGFSRPGTPVHVRSWSEGEVFHCAVKDTGRGLTPQQLAAVSSAQRRDRKFMDQQSLGLGLTLVSQLVARFHGHFQIESQPGEGSICRFSLPTQTEPVSTPR